MEKSKNWSGLIIKPSFYILPHSYDMLVRISCSGQHRVFHAPEHMHRRYQHIDCKTVLQIGCPWTSMLQMSNKQQHILCSFAHKFTSFSTSHAGIYAALPF
jgi:hypothetical protein